MRSPAWVPRNGRVQDSGINPVANDRSTSAVHPKLSAKTLLLQVCPFHPLPLCVRMEPSERWQYHGGRGAAVGVASSFSVRMGVVCECRRDSL